MEKTMKARIQHKHDIEANWLKATNFTPLAGEIIVYDSDENYDHPRIKTGDGKTNINDLLFIADYVLPVGGAELGGVKNGGNVVINPDGTMTASNGKVDFVAQDTPPEDTSVLWVDTKDNSAEELPESPGGKTIVKYVKPTEVPLENGAQYIFYAAEGCTFTIEIGTFEAQNGSNKAEFQLATKRSVLWLLWTQTDVDGSLIPTNGDRGYFQLEGDCSHMKISTTTQYNYVVLKVS